MGWLDFAEAFARGYVSERGVAGTVEDIADVTSKIFGSTDNNQAAETYNNDEDDESTDMELLQQDWEHTEERIEELVEDEKEKSIVGMSYYYKVLSFNDKNSQVYKYYKMITNNDIDDYKKLAKNKSVSNEKQNKDVYMVALRDENNNLILNEESTSEIDKYVCAAPVVADDIEGKEEGFEKLRSAKDGGKSLANAEAKEEKSYQVDDKKPKKKAEDLTLEDILGTSEKEFLKIS